MWIKEINYQLNSLVFSFLVSILCYFKASCSVLSEFHLQDPGGSLNYHLRDELGCFWPDPLKNAMGINYSLETLRIIGFELLRYCGSHL